MNNSYQQRLAELTSLNQQMDGYRPLDKLQVRTSEQQVRLEHVWSSNAIEGSSLSKSETESILSTGLTIHGKPLTETMAVVDLAEAYDYME